MIDAVKALVADINKQTLITNKMVDEVNEMVAYIEKNLVPIRGLNEEPSVLFGGMTLCYSSVLGERDKVVLRFSGEDAPKPIALSAATNDQKLAAHAHIPKLLDVIKKKVEKMNKEKGAA